MKKQHILGKVMKAFEKDPTIICSKAKIEETLGSDAKYLEEQLGLTKSDMIRLERLGLAMKAKYATKDSPKWALVDDTGNKLHFTGEHRVRWLIFEEAVYGKVQ